MTPYDMARELRAAGWEETGPGEWSSLGDYWQERDLPLAYGLMKELAQQRERGTVQTPLAGQEEQ